MMHECSQMQLTTSNSRAVTANSDEVLAEVREDRHCQDGIGGKVEEVEAIGVHDFTEELRVRRAEPAVEEDDEERIPGRVLLLGVGGKHPRARMRSRLRRPEEAVLVPQLHRTELGGTSPSPSEALRAVAPRPISRPSPSPYRTSGPWRGRGRGIVEVDGVGRSEDRSLSSLGEGGGRGFREVATKGKANRPYFPPLIRGRGGGGDVSPLRIKRSCAT